MRVPWERKPWVGWNYIPGVKQCPGIELGTEDLFLEPVAEEDTSVNAGFLSP